MSCEEIAVVACVACSKGGRGVWSGWGWVEGGVVLRMAQGRRICPIATTDNCNK
jgi:hypothetical protein